MQEKVPTSINVHLVRIEATKLVLVGMWITYQVTMDAACGPTTDHPHHPPTYTLLSLYYVLGCLRYTILSWVGNNMNIILKTSNSPTQCQPNPRKIRLKVAFGQLFPTANSFSWVRIVFI